MSMIWSSITPAPKAHLCLLLLNIVPLFIHIPVYFNIVLSAVLTVYAGSWRSVKESPVLEVMTKQEAARFPIVGSLALFSLFLAFKFLPKEIVNALLMLYIASIAVFVVAHVSQPYMQEYLPEPIRNFKLKLPSIKIPHVWDNSDVTKPSYADGSDLSCVAIAIAFCTWYILKKHWFANNVLGMAFCLEGIEQLSLGSFQVGTILLVGLFFYDIFWVFCTPVMVSVAKNFDAPIKLLFPRAELLETGKQAFSMLGLGDIVIPGIFLAFLLRYDVGKNFQTAYFQSAFAGYALGLSATIGFMHYFQAAQPALLYIVPSLLVFVSVYAIIRGELYQLWHYDESKVQKEAVKEDTKEAKKEQ